MSRWTIRTARAATLTLPILLALPVLPSRAAPLPGTFPPYPAREAFAPLSPRRLDPSHADLTVAGDLWSVRPGGTATAHVNVANGGPAEAAEPVLTMVLPKELTALDTPGCRKPTSSLSPDGVTTISCHWKRIAPADHRLVSLKVKAARLHRSDAARSRPEILLQTVSSTPDLTEEDNHASFRVRVRPLLPDPAKPAQTPKNLPRKSLEEGPPREALVS